MTKAQHCPNLTYLNLSFTNINDEGHKEIAKLTNLTSLNLGHTNINAAELKEIAKIKKLTYLSLTGCRNINAEGLKHLREELPNCKIRY